MKRQIILLLIVSLGAIKAYSQPSTWPFFADTFTKNAPILNYTVVSKTTAAASVNVSVWPDTVTTKISKFMFGTNTNQYNGAYNTFPAVVTYTNLMNPHIIRYPGGLHSNEFFWNDTAYWDNATSKLKHKRLPSDIPDSLLDSNGKKFKGEYVGGQGDNSWRFNLDAFYDFLKKTNSEALITVNYSYARYGTGSTPVQTAAHLAADWVRYDYKATRALGLQPTRFWEIGNENCANWASGYRINTATNKDGQPSIITTRLYGQQFKVFSDSMKAAATKLGTTIYLGGQFEGDFMSGSANSADWLVTHSYFTNYNENTLPAPILASAKSTISSLNTATSQAITGNNASPIPVAMTEWNIFAVGSKQCASYINGIHGVLAVAEMMKS